MKSDSLIKVRSRFFACFVTIIGALYFLHKINKTNVQQQNGRENFIKKECNYTKRYAYYFLLVMVKILSARSYFSPGVDVRSQRIPKSSFDFLVD